MNNERSFDVVVIGVGGMGSAACFHLARRGVRVLGLEQAGVPNDGGSSHGESRLVRLCYYEHPDYVPLLRRAYELWDELGGEVGAPLLRRTGGLFLGEAEGPFIRETMRAAELHGLPLERVGGGALARDFPQFAVAEGLVALHEANAGYVVPEEAVAAHVNLAMSAGAAVHGHEVVRSWSADVDHVRVETDRGAYRAERLVVCAGPWTGKVLAGLGLPLVVTRQVLGWVQPRAPERFQDGSFPVWALEEDDGFLLYGFPMLRGRVGLKVARHAPGEPTDPDAVDRAPRREDEAGFRGGLARLLPDADGPLLSMRTCLYTSTPDAHFVIGTHPRHERVHFAGGFSGHGFKFAPVMGEVLADLATRGATEHPIGFLRWERFQETG